MDKILETRNTRSMSALSLLLITLTAVAAQTPRFTMKESLKIVSSSSEFKELTADFGVRVDLRYATANNFTGRNLYGDFNRAYLHKVAADKLARAVSHLKAHHPGFQLIIFDALRPRSAQYILWDHVKGTNQEQYVANPEGGSVHNYGFAVDLSVVDGKGQELDMGTEFDTFSELSQPQLEKKFLEEGKLSARQSENRKILKEAMTAGGFTQLPHEWWHFDALPKPQVKASYKIVE